MYRSKLRKENINILGIEHCFTLVGNPACNSKVESVHRTMKSILKTYEDPTSWPLYIPFVIIPIISQYERDYQTTPAFRAYGFTLTTPGILKSIDSSVPRFEKPPLQLSAKKE